METREALTTNFIEDERLMDGSNEDPLLEVMLSGAVLMTADSLHCSVRRSQCRDHDVLARAHAYPGLNQTQSVFAGAMKGDLHWV